MRASIKGVSVGMADRIGFIGAGNMAWAIVEGLLKKGVALPENLAVCNRTPAKCARFAERGVRTMDSIASLSAGSDILFLSVKPQNYAEVLEELAAADGGQKLIVSIAAGISTAYIREKLGLGCRVVRAMPNTPLLLGYGATALSRGTGVSDEDFEKIRAIFGAGGEVAVLPEEKMNAVIAVSGSSPAYVYLFVKAVIDGAAQQGIDSKTAKRLICQTLVGSAAMILHSGMEPDELIRQVSSPGGTTLKALEALQEHQFAGAVADAMGRCTARAEELGQ